MIGATLDAGALIALDRSDRRMLVLLARVVEAGGIITVPATALAQVMRNPARQARLSRLVRQPTTPVPALDAVAAVQVGRLLGASRTSDIADAHVVLCARLAGGSVVTSDPQDLRRLDPTLPLITL